VTASGLEVEVSRRVSSAVSRAHAWLGEVRPAKLLVPAVAVQWLTTLGLALTVRHNGWVFYQGGDQLWYYVSGWLLAHGQIPTALVSHGWPAFLAPIAHFAGPSLVPALPAIVLFDVLVLGPVALLCMYGIAKEIGGTIFGYWAVLLWLAVPFIGIKYTDHLYHQLYTEVTLPQAFGLTAMADFPSTVAVLVCVYFALRVVNRPDAIEALAAGLAGGVAIAIKPSNSVFLVGVILGLAYRRRAVATAYVAVGLAPAILTLALWKYRGFGYVPLFHADAGRKLALGVQDQLVAFDPIHKYVHFDWHQLNLNLQGIKEHFWSLRVIEWLVFAGLIGLARRSVTALLVVGGWFAAFVVTKGTFAYAGVAGGSVFRIMMPSYPAFVLMIAGLVYLVPHGHPVPHRRPALRERPSESGRLSKRRRGVVLGLCAAVCALYPLALVAAASPLRGPRPDAYVVAGLIRSVDPALRLHAVREGKTVVLDWRNREPAAGAVFYRVWRSSGRTGGATCTPVANAPDDCQLSIVDLGARRAGRLVDRPGPGVWTYRLGLAANWLNSPTYGDVYTVGPPVKLRVR
jgi:hypothetical protein